MARKICNICNTRPVDKAAAIPDSCVPCYEEGGWENAHSDNSHDLLSGILAKIAEVKHDRTGAESFVVGAVELRTLARQAGIKNAGQHKSAELRAMIKDAIEAEQAGCWICHPELNEAQRPAKTRKASTGERPSRVGQVINVPLRAPGEVKAEVTMKKIGKPQASNISTSGGNVVLSVTLVGFTLRLVWDAEGHYNYAASSATLDGQARKVRNVAEALRIVGAK